MQEGTADGQREDGRRKDGQDEVAIADLGLDDLKGALVDGWEDFRRAPMFGLFFGGFYALGGLAMILLGADKVVWTFVVSLGFPLVAPFAAVGLYDVSRRMGRGEALQWRGVLGVVVAEKDRQIPWLGAIVVIYFLFWTFLAHMIFALFMGLQVMRNVSTSFEIFMTPNGLAMLGLGGTVGAVLATVLFSFTVFSLPMLLEREIDFVTAMVLSVRAVRANAGIMVIWAGLIAGLLFVGMLPYFLGLIVVLPVLGHATWHLYKRAFP